MASRERSRSRERDESVYCLWLRGKILSFVTLSPTDLQPEKNEAQITYLFTLCDMFIEDEILEELQELKEKIQKRPFFVARKLVIVQREDYTHVSIIGTEIELLMEDVVHRLSEAKHFGVEPTRYVANSLKKLRECLISAKEWNGLFGTLLPKAKKAARWIDSEWDFTDSGTVDLECGCTETLLYYNKGSDEFKDMHTKSVIDPCASCSEHATQCK